MIQIIDDDSAVRSSLSFMLKRAGYEAQVVPGPWEAIEVENLLHQCQTIFSLSVLLA